MVMEVAFVGMRQMAQRYISADQSIAAAGAAFVCMDDDFSDLARARAAAARANDGFGLRSLIQKLMVTLGLKHL
jgi:hypothetical protein